MPSALYYSKIEIPITKIPCIALNLDLTFNYCSVRAFILLCMRSCRHLLLNLNSGQNECYGYGYVIQSPLQSDYTKQMMYHSTARRRNIVDCMQKYEASITTILPCGPGGSIAWYPATFLATSLWSICQICPRSYVLSIFKSAILSSQLFRSPSAATVERQL